LDDFLLAIFLAAPLLAGVLFVTPALVFDADFFAGLNLSACAKVIDFDSQQPS
jgi:hypothetical protein